MIFIKLINQLLFWIFIYVFFRKDFHYNLIVKTIPLLSSELQSSHPLCKRVIWLDKASPIPELPFLVV